MGFAKAEKLSVDLAGLTLHDRNIATYQIRSIERRVSAIHVSSVPYSQDNNFLWQRTENDAEVANPEPRTSLPLSGERLNIAVT